jgi:hypothetical protein
LSLGVIRRGVFLIFLDVLGVVPVIVPGILGPHRGHEALTVRV